MDHYIQIYTTAADAYHRMIAAEDVEENLGRTLESVIPLKGRRVLDLGSGTGRIPLLLHGLAEQVTGLDLHMTMLREQARQREAAGGAWPLVCGDLRKLPFAGGSFDLVTAGWAMGHFCSWFPDVWRAELQRALEEIHRVVQPGGAIAIIETLTTGSLVPAAPTEDLAAYYAILENVWGFERQQIRTDYQFSSVEAAVEATEFFFGGEMSAAIRENGWSRLPEWTGVWGKRIPG